MKTGLTLTQMAAKVEAQLAQRRDYVVESHVIAMNDSGNELTVSRGNDILEFQKTIDQMKQIAEIANRGIG
jgi:hypothetical protein